jgi:hypothetical protein
MRRRRMNSSRRQFLAIVLIRRIAFSSTCSSPGIVTYPVSAEIVQGSSHPVVLFKSLMGEVLATYRSTAHCLGLHLINLNGQLYSWL